MEPPSPPLWETQKATKEDNTWIQAQKKEQEQESAACTCVPLFTGLSRCPTTNTSALHTYFPDLHIFTVGLDSE